MEKPSIGGQFAGVLAWLLVLILLGTAVTAAVILAPKVVTWAREVEL